MYLLLVLIQIDLMVQMASGKETPFIYSLFDFYKRFSKIKEHNRWIHVNDENKYIEDDFIFLNTTKVIAASIGYSEEMMKEEVDYIWTLINQVLWFWRNKLPCSSFNFIIGNQHLQIVEQYMRYIGIVFH